jgi:cell pole-organizing protein PopZ
MSDEKSQEEPTMEEILASIRRIISENDDGEAKHLDVGGSKGEAPVPLATTEEAEEKILELTEVFEEEAPAETAPVPSLVAAEPQPDALLAAPIEAASTAALFKLAQSLNPDRRTTGNIALGPGNTLEDLVRDMLRPMLKEWLDQNLAQIVGRLVEKEIERMARRAEES